MPVLTVIVFIRFMKQHISIPRERSRTVAVVIARVIFTQLNGSTYRLMKTS